MEYLSMSVPESMTRESNPRNCVRWIQKMGFLAVETLPENTMLWGKKEDVIVFEFKVN